MIFPVSNLKIYPKNSFFLIAGPCIIENSTLTFEIAKELKKICSTLKIPFIFKASYRKANRTRLDSFTGIGDIKGLEILYQIKKELNLCILTDIHESSEAAVAAKYVDILQIPAFLCRQTDLLIAAAKTGKPVNIKKGQFISVSSLKHSIDKVVQSGNKNILITERGNSFGYSDLVVDFRNIYLMKKLNVPVVLDVTHSLQQPNTTTGITGGNPEMIETLAKAGIASGIDGIFIETHPEPNKSKSDGANMLALNKIEKLLKDLVKIRRSLF